jgi:hypothetical protein
MKKLVLPALALSLIFTACSKTKKNDPSGGSSFKIGNKNYAVSTVLNFEEGLAAISGTNYLTINFNNKTLPTVSGVYQVSYDSIPNSLFFLVVTIQGSDTVGYFPAGPATANVTVSGGKVGVSFTGVKTYKFNNGGFFDSVMISANVKQN